LHSPQKIRDKKGRGDERIDDEEEEEDCVYINRKRRQRQD